MREHGVNNYYNRNYSLVTLVSQYGGCLLKNQILHDSILIYIYIYIYMPTLPEEVP